MDTEERIDSQAISATPEIADENETVQISDEKPVSAEGDFIEGQSENGDAPVKKKRKRRRLYEITLDNDIRYKAPLSYRHLRIIAWLLIALAQIAVLITAKQKIMGASDTAMLVARIFSFGANMTLPLFLLAAFSIILNAKDGYSKLLKSYGFLALLVFAITLFAYFHYLLGLLNAMTGGAAESKELLDEIVNAMLTSGFATFNIFVDLFLCTLFMFFLNYHPTKRFQGRKIVWFRLMAILPVAYEVVSIVLKFLTTSGTIILPLYIFPLLTTKPPVTFLVFIAMAFFIKFREIRYVKKGKKTVADYKEFLLTRANSLHFSIFTSVIFIIASVVDIILLFVIAIALIPNGAIDIESELIMSVEHVMTWGFGKSATLFLVAPIVMLFSYTKTHKKSMIDLLIPLAGVGLVLFIYLEGGFNLICMLF